jgi:1-acyl-sn-glycerol-3-phosphate acyltransferase
VTGLLGVVRALGQPGSSRADVARCSVPILSFPFHALQFPPVKAEPETSLEQLVSELLVDAGASRRPESSDVLLTDLGLDSLAVADVALAIEERLGTRLLDVEDGAVFTVGDVLRAIERTTPRRSAIPRAFGTWRGWVKPAGGAVIRPYTRLEVVGAEHVPPVGPVIIAPNHRSMLDIPVLVVAMPRKVTFMAKIELYGNPLFSLVWRKLAGFPVRREIADLRALDTALALLDRGEAVAVYPEGTRNKRGEPLLPFLQGAAWLALHTGVPIVPCGVSGTGVKEPIRKRRHVRVAFGEPIVVDVERDLALRRKKQVAITDELAEAVGSLLR